MFKFRKRKNKFVTVRAEDLQVGDRLVYDNVASKVLDITPDGSKELSVLLESTHLGRPCGSRIVILRNELLITVPR